MRGHRPQCRARGGGAHSVPDCPGGLTNASKHADHAAVSVDVRGTAADGLTVEIRNPWPVGVAGTTPIPGAGMGIIGLAERTALTGGRLEHGRTPEGEFRLWTWLPWPT